MLTPRTRRADRRSWPHRRRWFAARALVVAAFLWPGSISAHEPGIGRAVVTFPSPKECVVDLTVDAASLLARLERLAGQPRSGTVTGPESVARIAALQQEFMRHVRIRVDGADTTAVLESVREAADSSRSAGYPVAAEVNLRMRGTMTAGAKSATWRYDLTFAPYALIVREADAAEESTEWLEGGQESRAFSVTRVGERRSRVRVLATYGARASTYIRANAFACLVVVLGMVPFNRRLRSIMWEPTGPVRAPFNDDESLLAAMPDCDFPAFRILPADSGWAAQLHGSDSPEEPRVVEPTPPPVPAAAATAGSANTRGPVRVMQSSAQ